MESGCTCGFSSNNAGRPLKIQQTAAASDTIDGCQIWDVCLFQTILRELWVKPSLNFDYICFHCIVWKWLCFPFSLIDGWSKYWSRQKNTQRGLKTLGKDKVSFKFVWSAGVFLAVPSNLASLAINKRKCVQAFLFKDQNTYFLAWNSYGAACCWITDDWDVEIIMSIQMLIWLRPLRCWADYVDSDDELIMRGMCVWSLFVHDVWGSCDKPGLCIWQPRYVQTHNQPFLEANMCQMVFRWKRSTSLLDMMLESNEILDPAIAFSLICNHEFYKTFSTCIGCRKFCWFDDLRIQSFFYIADLEGLALLVSPGMFD